MLAEQTVGQYLRRTFTQEKSRRMNLVTTGYYVMGSAVGSFQCSRCCGIPRLRQELHLARCLRILTHHLKHVHNVCNIADCTYLDNAQLQGISFDGPAVRPALILSTV